MSYCRVAKGTAETAKNFVNITSTLSIRQQMRMALFFYNGLFDTSSVHLPDKVTRKQDLGAEIEFHEKVSEFMKSSDLLCSEVIVNSQQYKNREVVVLKVHDSDVVTVGVIQTILVRDAEVYLIVRKYEASRNRLNYFVTDTAAVDFSFVNVNHLADHKPLIKFGTEFKFKFYLHHHVSHSFE